MSNHISEIKIGNVKVFPNIAVAPLAGYTDFPYRKIVAELGGAGIAYTELISCHALAHEGKKTHTLIATSPDEHPLGMQIFGADYELMAAGASSLEEYGADIIDINMGCPVSKVVKSGGGAVIMTDPATAEKVVKECVKAVSIPVTVKIRTGWNAETINAPEFAKRMAGAGAAAIAVHGRTRAQGYSGKADWKIIAEVVNSVDVPVFGNGDIVDGSSAVAMFEQTGCAGIMIGRAAMGAPWFFKVLYNYLTKGKEEGVPSPQDRGKLAWKHFCMLKDLYGEKTACLHIRRIACCYARGLDGAKEFRRKIVQVLSAEEVKIKVSNYFGN